MYRIMRCVTAYHCPKEQGHSMAKSAGAGRQNRRMDQGSSTSEHDQPLVRTSAWQELGLGMPAAGCPAVWA